jgi:hypothetical protein
LLKLFDKFCINFNWIIKINYSKKKMLKIIIIIITLQYIKNQDIINSDKELKLNRFMVRF